jgi:hypothetical protein
MVPVFSFIRKIHWVDVDEELYKRINTKNDHGLSSLLSSSRYSHYKLKKCYPSSNDCHECFKYWCGICRKGSNCMLMQCNNTRCANFIEKCKEIFVIKSNPLHIYIFKRVNYSFFGEEKKHILRGKDTYNFYEVKDIKVSSEDLYKNKAY